MGTTISPAWAIVAVKASVPTNAARIARRIWHLRQVAWCRYSISGVLVPKGSITGRIRWGTPRKVWVATRRNVQRHSRARDSGIDLSGLYIHIPGKCVDWPNVRVCRR